MIVSGHPEDRHHGPLPLPLEDAGERGGGEGLVDGVERTGEQPRLLAGGDRQCAGLAQPGQRRIPGRAGHDGLAPAPDRTAPSLVDGKLRAIGANGRRNDAERHADLSQQNRARRAGESTGAAS